MTKSDLHEKLKIAMNEHRNGSIRIAESLYKEILTYRADHPDASHNLSILYLENNNLEKAKIYIDKTINNQFVMPEYFITAAKIYRLKNDEGTSDIIDKGINLFPQDEQLYFYKSAYLRDQKKIEQATQYMAKSLSLKPDDPSINNSFGVILGEQGKFSEALNFFKKAVDGDNSNAEFLLNLGLCYQKVQEIKKALEYYTKSIEIDPHNFKAFINIGSLFQEMGNKEKTIYYYEKARDLEPKNAEIYNNLGIAYGEFGEREKAATYYRKSLDIDPNFYPAFRHLCTTGEIKTNDPIFIRMKDEYAKTSDAEDKVIIGFGLAFIYDKSNQYKTAFTYLKEVNDIACKRINYTNDIKIVVKETIEKNNLLAKKNIKYVNDWKPIFIVGMPRSGTSMLEKVIGNNMNVDELGELPTMNSLISLKIKNDIGWPYNISEYEYEDIDFIANKYIDIAKQIKPDLKNIFTDKMPANFPYIGIIKLAFPKAKFIHTIRNPYDNAISIYLLKLSDAHRYTFNLSHIAEYYNYHIKLMDYWKNIYPNDILTMKYEDFVENPIKKTKDIYSFCGLDYQSGNERFDLNKSNTRTASNHQVTEKLSKKSIDRWKNYKDYVQILLDEIKI
mgnify:FL=1|tara:strand:- start:4033 stop:5880 length:1848 start_codon:yes stop_codon:yes gene_type:complete